MLWVLGQGQTSALDRSIEFQTSLIPGRIYMIGPRLSLEGAVGTQDPPTTIATWFEDE